jgi:hypothetical protein
LHPKLKTNGLPRQYGTNGTARGNLTETQANPDKTNEVDNDETIFEASTVHSNDVDLSTEELNQLVQIRKIMTMFTSLVPDQEDLANPKVNMGMTDHYNDLDVHCKREIYAHAFAMFQRGHYFSTTDNGGDTCILGKGWKFIKFYLHRSVNIVGYHEAHTQHRRCKIGQAYGVMQDIQNKDYLIIANEDVRNEGSTTSSLLEF